MSVCKLTVFPRGKQSFCLILSDKSDLKINIDDIINNSSEFYIFSDLAYEFSLSCDNSIRIRGVNFFVNDVCVPCIYNNGHIIFKSGNISNNCIFIDCYGFVEITLEIIDFDGVEYRYSSEYIPVLVRKGEFNDNVKAMVHYVYTNQEHLLLNGESKAKNIANLKDKGYQNLSSKIILAEEIANMFEYNYSYFKANSRFILDKIPKIDRFERLQYVSPSTVQYIVTHPEELRKVSSNFGIRVDRYIYQPEKTLSMQNERSYDIYENRVVLGFIKKMIDSINKLYSDCYRLIDHIPNKCNYNIDYIYSSFFMFIETKKTLEIFLVRLKNLLEKFSKLWGMYSNALKIPPEIMVKAPKLTSIFKDVPQYNCIFVQIYKWFKFGIYDFSKENFMLSFIKISSLYESYLLLKMIAYFKNRGYLLENAKKFLYPLKHSWRYKNTNFSNTFILKNDYQTLTLYYQPIIYNTDKSNLNGIGLMRNNSLSIVSDNETDDLGGEYYSPDYLIKLEKDSYTKYLILDAKFSNISCVKRFHIKNLAFKYLFSISPILKEEILVGLCIIYGKCGESEQLQSVYDKHLNAQNVRPIAELLPMLEGIANEKHFNRLDALMKFFIL